MQWVPLPRWTPSCARSAFRSSSDSWSDRDHAFALSYKSLLHPSLSGLLESNPSTLDFAVFKRIVVMRTERWNVEKCRCVLLSPLWGNKSSFDPAKFLDRLGTTHPSPTPTPHCGSVFISYKSGNEKLLHWLINSSAHHMGHRFLFKDAVRGTNRQGFKARWYSRILC